MPISADHSPGTLKSRVDQRASIGMAKLVRGHVFEPGGAVEFGADRVLR